MFKRILNSFHDIFFPNNCVACNNYLFENEIFLCFICNSKANWIPYSDKNCSYLTERFYGKFQHCYLLSLLTYDHDEISSKLIHAMKYKNRPKIGTFLAEKIISNFKHHPVFTEIDYLIQIPLHPNKLKKRGYNQLELFTTKLSEYFKIPVLENHVIRSKNTTAQALKNKAERLKNTDIFKIKEEINLTNKHLLIIDDVVTTGSTLTNFVNTIIDKNSCKISILCIAVAR